MRQDHLGLMILQQAERHAARNALYARKGGQWKAMTWKEVGEKVSLVAMGLIDSGLSEGEMAGIFSANRPEWTVCDYGIMCARGVSVPFHSGMSDSQAEYLVGDAGVKVLFVDGQAQYDVAARVFVKSRVLKRIVVFDESVKIMEHPEVMHFSKFLEKGRYSSRDGELKRRMEEATSDDVCTIIYTSGTTGEPKGAVLTHANFFCVFHALDERFPMNEHDSELCFLPLSHSYARVSGFWVHSHGTTVYYCDDPRKVVEYFQETSPTYMVGVPRFYEKVYAALNRRIDSYPPMRRRLFRWALAVGRKYRYRKFRKAYRSPFLRLMYFAAYRLALRRIRKVLGGKLNFFSAGGAPLSREIEDFFFSINIYIAQGYGLTETSAIITCNYPGRFRFGTPGTVIPGCEVKVEDDGEILVRGANVMKGYHRKPEATAEVFTGDGWLKTGDIGYLDKDGFLHITDRKKDIIVTAGGKNVAPQTIESLFGQDYYIDQVAVIGDRRRFLTALVVPDFEALEHYARENGIAFGSRAELIGKKEIIDFYRARIDAMSAYMAKFERIVRFALLEREFSHEAGEITPTMKIRRNVIEEKYRTIIDEMYKE